MTDTYLQPAALLLIEFQNEWLTPEGKLNPLMQDRDLFLQSQLKAKQVLEAAREKLTLDIIHSGLSFNADYKELGDCNAGLRAGIKRRQTFLKGTSASDFHKDFEPKEQEFITAGRIGASAFCGSNLDCYLKRNRIHTLYIMGYALHVCVESTIREAHDRGYEVILIHDASCAFNQLQQDYVRDHVIPHFGSSISADEFIKLGGE